MIPMHKAQTCLLAVRLSKKSRTMKSNQTIAAHLKKPGAGSKSGGPRWPILRDISHDTLELNVEPELALLVLYDSDLLGLIIELYFSIRWEGGAIYKGL